MTPQEKQAVSISFGRVFPFRAKLTTLFYDKLFTAAPQLRGLFPDDMRGQKNKLAQTLHFVVTHLDDPDTLSAAVSDLGQKHRGYGASPEGYALVGQCLVAALREVTPGGIDEREADAWAVAYQAISGMMMLAAKQADAA
ncbi:MAG: globin domain-containing protein [Shimia sp.]